MDLHCDILLRVLEEGVDLLSPPHWAQATIPNLLAGNVTEQVFAVWVDSRQLKGLQAAQAGFRMIDAFHRQLALHQDSIALVRNTQEAEAARAAGRIAIYLWLEGGALIAEDLALLRIYHQLGARGMTLTWANNVPWAGSSTDAAEPYRGLTPFGREVVREMKSLPMIVDLSHVSVPTFYDALEEMDVPVICSHSGCRALADHPRNLDDDQLRAVAKSGGVVGIFVVPEFLDLKWTSAWKATERHLEKKLAAMLREHEGKEKSARYRLAHAQTLQAALAPENIMGLQVMLDHIDHAVKIAGVEHVAFGSDFDGTWAFPTGIETPRGWPVVMEALRARGYDDGALVSLSGGNARRVFRAVLDRP